jgi:GalNAc-alpha-(1->4)-GalNAc-alpha-(1->3)-diNAcBac-PP-undecaprenol alpha-1,4-N-acetyl-D-galactosaminyltransferase
MRLALVIASLGTGGAERVMSLLANSWAERGDDVSLITLESHEHDAYPLDARIKRIALGLVHDSGGLARALTNNFRRIAALRRALRASRASVAVSFEETTNALVMVASLGLPMRRVLSERTDPLKHRIGRAWQILRRLTYPFADALVVQTARLLPWARAVTLGRTRAHVIPNPLRSMRVSRAPDSDSAPARRIVALGRLWYEKGYDVLIRAFANVAAEFPLWTLTIIGEGPERESLTELARSLGVAERLSLPGWMATPEAELTQGAIFVMSSRYEGFSNATLEAMGLGLPVISTACGGSEEMITDGKNGMIVPVDDVGQLSDAMRQLMRDEGLRKRMGLSALAVSERYLPRSILPLWDTLLSEPCLPRPATKSFS